MIPDSVTWELLIGVIALALSIIGIYYTHKSIRSPALLEARLEHTKELKGFLKEWRDQFPVGESSMRPKTTPTLSTQAAHLPRNLHVFPQIENDWRYKDLVDFHLPNEHRLLPAEWEEYMKKFDAYETLRYVLFEKIRDYVLERSQLKYDPDWKYGGISEHFISVIYSQWICSVKEKRFYHRKEEIEFKEEKNELWLSASGLVKGTREEREKGKGVLLDMMFQEVLMEKHRTEIQEILVMEKELGKTYNEMTERLERLMGYPLFPGTKCGILKNA